MTETVGDFIIRRLNEWGVKRIYGYPGDGINGIMGALDRHQGTMEFIQVRHEESAAFMACGHAKFTCEVGVCLATSGPGAIHLLNGLYDARMDHQPVVAIVGQQSRSCIGGDYQQEVDLVSLFKDVASRFVHQATIPSQVRQLVDRAVRIAIADRTVTCIIVPNDLQEMPMEEPKYKHGHIFTGVGYSAPEILPVMSDLQAAADILNGGNRVAILAGAGAMHAAEELITVTNLLGAGVAKALLGKAVLPDDLPFVTGSIGLLGTEASWALMSECDTLLMVGTAFPYAEFLPKEGQAKGVQIDINARMLSSRYPCEINLHGDSRYTLRALIPLLEEKTDRTWRVKVEESVRRWWEMAEARAMAEADRINPQRVAWELSPLLPEQAIITCDSGATASWYARDIRIRPGMMCSLSGNLATMCPGVPYAIAAKFTYPERVPVAMVGDGAMQMLGINDLITIRKYMHLWEDRRIVIVVFNNRDLNMVTWEQRIMEGNPKFSGSQDLPDFPYARFARDVGLHGIDVDRTDQLVPAFREAFSTNMPTLIDVQTDPNVPPLPPHVTLEQAKNYLFALLKGDPDMLAVIRQSARQMMAGTETDRKERKERKE